MALTSAVAGAPVGWLADRVGARIVVSAAMLGGGLLLALLSLLTPQLWHLYIVFAAIGAVATGASSVGYARAVSSWFVRHRGLALGIAISGGSIGGIVFPAVAHALLPIVGWRMTYAILGLSIVVIGLPITRRFIDERDDRRSGAARAVAGLSVRDGVRTRMFWILLAMVFCASLAQSSTLVHLPALLGDHGLSAGQSAAALSVMGLASICGRLATGWLRRSLLRGAGVGRAAALRRRRRVPAVDCRVVCDRSGRRLPHRLWYERRDGRRAVPAVALLRAAIVLHALRSRLDVVRGGGCRWSDRDGAGV